MKYKNMSNVGLSQISTSNIKPATGMRDNMETEGRATALAMAWQ